MGVHFDWRLRGPSPIAAGSAGGAPARRELPETNLSISRPRRPSARANQSRREATRVAQRAPGRLRTCALQFGRLESQLHPAARPSGPNHPNQTERTIPADARDAAGQARPIGRAEGLRHEIDGSFGPPPPPAERALKNIRRRPGAPSRRLPPATPVRVIRS